MKTLALSAIFCSSLMYAGPIAITEIGGFVHGNGGLIAQLDPASSGYFATLDGNNLGTFGWTFANTSGAVITDAALLVFLDADIDETTNTFFNEYGQFVSLVLPPGAPSGATTASSWEMMAARCQSPKRWSVGGLVPLSSLFSILGTGQPRRG